MWNVLEQHRIRGTKNVYKKKIYKKKKFTKHFQAFPKNTLEEKILKFII